MAPRLFADATLNNRKITIALAEMRLPCAVAPVDLEAGEQRSPAFLAISRRGRTPAPVATDSADDTGADSENAQ